MTRFVFATATTLDGYLADPNHSLDWLFVVDGGQESLSDMNTFAEGVGVMVEGSSTYRWIVEHENLLEHPEKWQEFHGDRPTYVFTSRTDLPVIPGADKPHSIRRRWCSGRRTDRRRRRREARRPRGRSDPRR